MKKKSIAMIASCLFFCFATAKATVQEQEGQVYGEENKVTRVEAQKARIIGADGNCVKEWNGRCYGLVVNASVGKRFSKYNYELVLNGRVSPATENDGALIYAESQSGKFTPLIYSPSGWVAAEECGVTIGEQARNCYIERGVYVQLNTELTNGFLSDMDLIIKYHAVRRGVIVESGYAYQCTRFGGAAFCLSL